MVRVVRSGLLPSLTIWRCAQEDERAWNLSNDRAEVLGTGDWVRPLHPAVFTPDSLDHLAHALGGGWVVHYDFGCILAEFEFDLDSVSTRDAIEVVGDVGAKLLEHARREGANSRTERSGFWNHVGGVVVAGFNPSDVDHHWVENVDRLVDLGLQPTDRLVHRRDRIL